MKIYSWNVNGIRAVIKKGLFLPFIEEHQPDILCLQEIKAKPEQVDLDLPSYEQHWHPADKPGYAGTAIFSKIPTKNVFLGLPGHLHTSALTDTFGDTTTEGRVLTLEFDDYFVSTVYTPNAKEGLERLTTRQAWDAAYLACMRELQSQKPVIFCGDLNVAHTEDDLARPKENRGNKGFTDEERAGFDAIVNAGFLDTFRLFQSGNGYYTWWSHWGKARERNVGWRIDYVLASTSLAEKVQEAAIHPQVFGSDHCPVSATFSF